jgi:hypothetical protein
VKSTLRSSAISMLDHLKVSIPCVLRNPNECNRTLHLKMSLDGPATALTTTLTLTLALTLALSLASFGSKIVSNSFLLRCLRLLDFLILFLPLLISLLLLRCARDPQNQNIPTKAVILVTTNLGFVSHALSARHLAYSQVTLLGNRFGTELEHLLRNCQQYRIPLQKSAQNRVYTTVDRPSWSIGEVVSLTE